MSKKIKLSPVHLQYWCKTKVIDEIVCQKIGIEFDKDLAESIENSSIKSGNILGTRHYFIVDKKGNYDVVSGVDFEVYFNEKEVEIKDRVSAPEMKLTPEIRLVIDKFIKEVHGV